MSKGYVVCVAGLLGWLGVLAIGIAFTVPGTEEGNFVLSLAFSILAVGFVAGSLMIAGSKGYHWTLGLIFGLTSPLGLLVLTLLPKRKWMIEQEQREAKKTESLARLPRMSSFD